MELILERSRAGGRRERLIVGMIGWGREREGGDEGGEESKSGGEWRARAVGEGEMEKGEEGGG